MAQAEPKYQVTPTWTVTKALLSSGGGTTLKGREELSFSPSTFQPRRLERGVNFFLSDVFRRMLCISDDKINFYKGFKYWITILQIQGWII